MSKKLKTCYVNRHFRVMVSMLRLHVNQPLLRPGSKHISILHSTLSSKRVATLTDESEITYKLIGQSSISFDQPAQIKTELNYSVFLFLPFAEVLASFPLHFHGFPRISLMLITDELWTRFGIRAEHLHSTLLSRTFFGMGVRLIT